MSKFCGNCGTQLDDNAAVCTNCGASVSLVASKNNSGTPAENVISTIKEKSGPFVEKLKSDKKFLFTVLGGVVAAILVLVLLFSLLFGGGYKRAVNNYIDAEYYGSFKSAVKCMPDEFWEYMEDEMNMDMDDLEDDFEESFEYREDELKDEYGKNYKVKYKITDKDELDDDDLDEIKDNLKEMGIKKKDVKKAMEVELELTIKGSEDKDTDDITLNLVKIGSKWYVFEF